MLPAAGADAVWDTGARARGARAFRGAQARALRSRKPSAMNGSRERRRKDSPLPNRTSMPRYRRRSSAPGPGVRRRGAPRTPPGGKFVNPAKRQEIFARLRAQNPEPRSELDYRSPFELLVAVILSAQATDKSVNLATPRLFAVADTPAKMARARRGEACRLHQDDRSVPLQGEAHHRHLPAARRAARRRGAADPRGAASAARGRAQDRQRDPQHRLRPAHHRRGHPHLSRRQPHRHRAGEGRGRSRSPAAQVRPRGVPPPRPPLADPARPLRVQGAQARLRRLSDPRPVRVSGQDAVSS